MRFVLRCVIFYDIFHLISIMGYLYFITVTSIRNGLAGIWVLEIRKKYSKFECNVLIVGGEARVRVTDMEQTKLFFNANMTDLCKYKAEGES